MPSARFVAALLTLSFIGCTGTSTSSSSGAPADAPDGQPEPSAVEAGTVTCQNDHRVDTYVANLAKASQSGALRVTLASIDPAPPAIGTNGWTIRITDGSGTPMSNAPLTVTPFMPDHGHGSSIRAIVTPGSDGTYTVSPLYLFMPGVWRVTFALPAGDAGRAESVEFFFCIAG